LGLQHAKSAEVDTVKRQKLNDRQRQWLQRGCIAVSTLALLTACGSKADETSSSTTTSSLVPPFTVPAGTHPEVVASTSLIASDYDKRLAKLDDAQITNDGGRLWVEYTGGVIKCSPVELVVDVKSPDSVVANLYVGRQKTLMTQLDGSPDACVSAAFPFAVSSELPTHVNANAMIIDGSTNLPV
jgi:hypothetical protein